MTFCSKCGKQNSEDSAFCNYCGSSINNNSRPIVSSPPYSPKKGGGSEIKIAGIAVAVVLLVIVGLYFLNPLTSGNMISTIVDPPRPQVISVSGHDSYSNFDYTYKVAVTVKNNGGTGNVEVFAEINGAGKYEQQSKTVYLQKGESKSMEFTFDLSVWGALGQPSINYRAWANAK
jgi:hypothetical protein